VGVDGVDIRVYRRGIEVHIDTKDKGVSGGSIRGEVGLFSDRSRKRLGWVFANVEWRGMLTLTYHKGFPGSGVESKRHLRRVTDELTRDGVRYLWVVEWQARGYPHYHIWVDQENLSWHKYTEIWLRQTVQYNAEPAARRVHLHEQSYTAWDCELSLGYACKYAAKQKQKWLPDGVATYGRWWGASIDAVQCEDRIVLTEDKECVAMRRNIRRCMEHWSGRKKKRRTNQSLQWVLTNSRKWAILRLVKGVENEREFACSDAENGRMRKSTALWTATV